MMHGFKLASIAVVGTGKPPAVLEFSDGLNVIAGASDTGKSYALSCIDFALGASRPPRSIKEAEGYQAVILKISERSGQRSFEIRRSLAGGDATLRTLAGDGTEISNEQIQVKHNAEDRGTLSGGLLNLSGLWGKKLRKNEDGKLQSLSFRNVAHLCLVDEERIISAEPPQLTGSVVSRTAESDLFRLMVTGSESPPVIKVTSTQKANASSKRELLDEMIIEQELEIKALGVLEDVIERELSNVEQARQSALSQFEEARAGVVSLEKSQGDLAKELRELQSKNLVVNGLRQRFDLLKRHYDSDLNRLALIEESGSLLESFPAQTCPVCGSDPMHHRPDECDKAFSVSFVRDAARAEIAKISALKRDLDAELRDLQFEALENSMRIDAINTRLEEVEATVTRELMPRVKATTDLLNSQTSLRDRLLRAQAVGERLTDLRRRKGSLSPAALQKVVPIVVAPSDPSTADLENFCQVVEGLLKEWKYPDNGRVVFSEASRDIVIAGQPRNSHGKGVRALTCSAVILGLMRHCLMKELPHPGFVVLDSPLVAYKEPDPGRALDDESLKLRAAGVKDAFYTTLADTSSQGQVVIFENDDPPNLPGIVFRSTHFTKSNTGRHGFFPPLTSESEET